ncbi:FHA domain-containing protein [Clostridium sp. MSJ-11]|uniref:FHA domain-containing protein n=1 Tax=Clostridium mobile TaxID=2841512 RepID=A0ABS6EIW4_9CLOT|nr:FHA domain-containing protein [Clostridium mobile]MBU5485163.1 FHA domain-containing protein [Clostridium mobile]
MLIDKISYVFTIFIIAIIYLIIWTSLKIMNKDMKSNGKKSSVNKSAGFEIIEPGNSSNLKKGGVIPIKGEITIGRKEGNTFILDDPYISSFHARVYFKNDDYIIEDLDSTNGILVNEVRIEDRTRLKIGDIIKIGNTILKFI